MSGEPPRTIATTCPYCGVGCGVLASREVDDTVVIAGDPVHPANEGRLCSKGSALAETLGLDGRLLHPEIQGRRASWDEALDTVAQGFARVIEAHGPQAVAFYVSGQLLTEDYYVANKLMKGFIGSGNIDTNSRLCMASPVAGHKRAFGADVVPGNYEDFALADLIVLVGSNLAWCHPVLFQRIARAKDQRPGMKVIVIDPRRTATCTIADLHLSLAPGTDGVLFNGLLEYLRREDALDYAFLEAHTEGFAAALAAARASAPTIPAVAHDCGLPEEQIAAFYRLFARTAQTVTVFSQGINQSSSGTDKVNAIINCHLATGRIGQPGVGPFSITGQPNAMGGREVGGLATQLAAHMDFTPADQARVARFWGSERTAGAPGLKAVDLFEAIERGDIKAVWIMATNPAVSLPQADRVVAALAKCELVVVSDCVRHTDTTALAHVLLPAAAWGEKEGTVTNSERRLSRQRAFLTPPGEARPDWWIITEVARRMGYAAAFDYERTVEIFREHARLSGLDNHGQRAFDISALAQITDADYDDLRPVQWPVNQNAPRGTPRLCSDGRFFTASGKARLIAVTPRPPAQPPDDDYPFVLNTGRVRDQWHTMTRTGKSPRLSGHAPEPYVQIHPDDAARTGLRHGGLAWAHSRHGEVLVRVAVNGEQRAGSVFVPLHWSAVQASHARVDALVAAITDPISGQPEFKHTPVQVMPYAPAWQAFVLSREPIETGAAAYRVTVNGTQHWRYELAGDETRAWPAWARATFTAQEWLESEDVAAGAYRAACINDGRLQACVFVARTSSLLSRDWLGSLFVQSPLAHTDRASLLAARPYDARAASGPSVCACFGVARDAIAKAVRAQRLTSVEAVGRALGAGTNCGSCIPEIQTILRETTTENAA
jgi:assimilatory nitrate reductase catalytic subunit